MVLATEWNLLLLFLMLMIVCVDVSQVKTQAKTQICFLFTLHHVFFAVLECMEILCLRDEMNSQVRQ